MKKLTIWPRERSLIPGSCNKGIVPPASLVLVSRNNQVVQVVPGIWKHLWVLMPEAVFTIVLIYRINDNAVASRSNAWVRLMRRGVLLMTGIGFRSF